MIKAGLCAPPFLFTKPCINGSQMTIGPKKDKRWNLKIAPAYRLSTDEW